MRNHCEYCRTEKQPIEWHHPIQAFPDIGLYLCQKCHSLIQGRKRVYNAELDKDMRLERSNINKLVRQCVADGISALANYLAEDNFKG